MSDDELILALADLPASEIAWKLEVPLSHVLAVLRTKTRRYKKRIDLREIRLAVGEDEFTANELAQALDADTVTIRTRLSLMEKQGLAEKVGSTISHNQQAVVWRLRVKHK